VDGPSLTARTYAPALSDVVPALPEVTVHHPDAINAEAINQAQLHLELVQQLAGQQDSADPFSPWRDVSLHAHLAVAHVELVIAPTAPAVLPPASLMALEDREYDEGEPAARSRALLDVAGALLEAVPTATETALGGHLYQARLALGRALSFVPTHTPQRLTS
jgi:hypothetical protein